MSNTFDDDRDRHANEAFRIEEAPPPPRSGCRGFLMGCGCALAGLLVVVIGIAIWLAVNWKGWVAGFSKQVAAAVVAKSTLAPADKARILKRIDGLADDFKAGKLSPEQAKRVLEQIAQSPLFPIALVMTADEQYVKPSALTEEEKEAARRTLQRLARRAFEKKIPDAELQDVMHLLMQRQPDGSEHLKQTLTDTELKAFVDKAREKADAAAVPDEPFDVNIADELEKAIDRALK